MGPELPRGSDRGAPGCNKRNIMKIRVFSVISFIIGLIRVASNLLTEPANNSENVLENQTPLQKFKNESIYLHNCMLSERILPRRATIKWYTNRNPIGVNLRNILMYLKAFSQVSFEFDKGQGIIKTNTITDCLILNGIEPNSLFSRSYLRTRVEEIVTQLVR